MGSFWEDICFLNQKIGPVFAFLVLIGFATAFLGITALWSGWKGQLKADSCGVIASTLEKFDTTSLDFGLIGTLIGSIKVMCDFGLPGLHQTAHTASGLGEALWSTVFAYVWALPARGTAHMVRIYAKRLLSSHALVSEDPDVTAAGSTEENKDKHIKDIDEYHGSMPVLSKRSAGNGN